MTTAWSAGAWASVLGFAFVACAAHEAPTPVVAIDEAREVLIASQPRYHPVGLPEGSRLGAERSAERPTCTGGDQPVLVTSELADDGPRMPTVWACATGCGPGLEYAARATRHCPRRRLGCDFGLQANCEPPCAEGEHRDRHGLACQAGPEDADLHRAREREQRGQWVAYFERERRTLDAVEARVSRLEASPRPWTSETMAEAVDLRAQSHFEGLLHPLEDRAHPRGGDVDTRLADPVALRSSKTREKAIDARLARLDVHAREYRARHDLSYVTKDGKRAPGDLPEFDAFCRSECDRTRDLCRHYCQGGPERACDTCERNAHTCTAGVIAFQRRRDAGHHDGDVYPNACGLPSDCTLAMKQSLIPWGGWDLLKCP